MQNLNESWPCGFKNGMRNWVNFHSSTQKSEKFYFDALLLSKAYKLLNGKVQKSYLSWHWRAMQSLKKNWLLVLKMTWWICWILMQAVASLKICNLICYFCRKYIMFEPKKYRGVICHNTEEWCKIWGETDFCFEKWHEEFGENWLNTFKRWIKKNYRIKELQRSYVSLHWRMR